MMTSPAEILRTLVAIPSVSSLSNGPLLDVIDGILTPHGWHVERLPYVAADGLEKANMVAIPQQYRAALPEVDLLFVCHTDTVPYRKDWAAATQAIETDGSLHGCGTCDVKGSLAGLLAAALEIHPPTLGPSVAFAFTSEEEIGCIGATKLAASGVVRPKRVIVCEPTSLRPATAGKGYGLAEIRVLGHEAHSAFPAKGASAINMAAHFIVALEQWQKTSGRPTDSRFEPPLTTFNVGVLQGGSAKNIIAGECTFLVEWRPLPSEDPREGGVILQQIAEQVSAESPSCTVTVKPLRADVGFANPPSSRLGPSLSQTLNRPETGICFGSEATRFATLAEEIVVIGPGDMETAHSERECIPLNELDEWTATVKYLMLHGIGAEPTRV